MNKRMVFYLLMRVLGVIGLLMFLPAGVGIYDRNQSWLVFALTGLVLVAVSLLFGRKPPQNKTIYIKEGFVTVAASWFLLSAVGAIPMVLCGAIPSFTDAFFEMASGFTTTGASILSDVEALPRSALFWRSFSNWIGGMGVLVFVMAIMPMGDNQSMVLMRAEVPGPVKGKLVPRMKSTAKILYALYSGMTILLIVLLLLGGVNLFDAVCTAFATAGTGGFSVRNAGIAFYNSAYVDVVLSAFMLLFAVNFNLYYLLLIRRFKDFLRSEELKWFILIVSGSVLMISTNILPKFENFLSALRYAFFQVSTVISTTGFATDDFALWPTFSQGMLVLLMFVGGMAGSTGGGFKVSRVAICVKSFISEVRHMLHPRAVTFVRFEGKVVDKNTLYGIRNYLIGYVLITIALTLAVSALDGQYDLTTNLTAAIACFNNIGPGLGAVGPAGNFSGYSIPSKLLLSMGMITGRLELFPVLILLSPRTWKKSYVA